MAISALRRSAGERRDRAQEEQAGPSLDARCTPKRERAVKSATRRHSSSGPAFASISMSRGGPQPVADIASGKKDPVAAAVLERPAVPAWRVTVGNLAAGAVAGCFVEAALYPLDTIKTRMQLASKGGGFRALVSSGGGKALYAGITGNLVGVAPASAIFMAVYEPSKSWIYERHGQQAASLGAGALAGLAASLVRVPTEVIKQRMQAGQFKSATQAVKTVMASQGVRGMYAGYFAFLLRDLPFDAIEFWAYDTIMSVYQKSLAAPRDLYPWEAGAAGAAAGAITGFSTTPLDVLKTRLMTQGSTPVGTEVLYKNVFDCAARIYREEGAVAFLKGWEPRVIWISIGGCVFFTALEQCKKAFIPEGAQTASSH